MEAPQMLEFTPQDVRTSFARNLRETRERVGLTRKELAKRCKFSQRGVEMIYQLERGLSAPSLDRLSTLAAALGVTPAALLGLESDAAGTGTG